MLRILLIVLLGFPAAARAQHDDWPKAIATVSELSETYIAFGLRKMDSPSLQSAVGQIGLALDIEEHRCAIIGRMLGQIDAVAALESREYPPISDALDGYEAANIGASLANWVRQAKIAIGQSEDERIRTWNLDCVGSYVPRSAHISHNAPEAAFDLKDTALFVYGDIDGGFYERFLGQLNAHPEIKDIYLGSGGGSVKDAILAGREIRRRGLSTTLFGNCYSACPLVFVGGAYRTIWADVRHDFGFHRLSLPDGSPLPDNHEFYKLISAYVTEMGVDGSTYVGWMLSADPGEMLYQSGSILCDVGIASFVQRICGWE